MIGCFFHPVHCIGYLKSWHPANAPVFGMDRELDITSSSCFFAIGKKVEVLAERKNIRSDEINDLQLEFSCRCAADGRYLHVDPRFVAPLLNVQCYFVCVFLLFISPP